ncbi:MAG: DUF72 domain-containing protein [Candidatus Nitrosocosmicus sp.]
MNLYVGCSGWSYKGWVGTFYPSSLENKNWLSYYSKFFKFVEIDSTFYSIPSRFITRGWKDKTPSDFKFALKFPKIITHDKKMENISKELSVFFSNIEPLLGKTLFLLIQLPPFLTENEGFDSLQDLINRRDRRFDYAIEFRDPSWFNDKVYDFLKNNKITLAWSVRDELKTPPIITSDQIYIRFIGDRSINEKDFGRIVKDRKKEMQEYADILNAKVSEQNQSVSIAFNNHYAGFGPESATTFLKMMDKPSATSNWTKEIQNDERSNTFSLDNKHQTNLFDYTSFK